MERLIDRIEALEELASQQTATITRLEAEMLQLATQDKLLAEGIATNNGQTQEMYEIFLPAKKFFIACGKLYDFIAKIGEVFVKLAKPIIFLVALCIALLHWLKTGKWELILP